MFYTWSGLAELSRRVRQTPFEGVSEQYRGWRWTEAPVAPMYDVRLGVSDVVSGYCETGRNVYVKYVLRRRQRPNPVLERGRLVHAARAAAISAAKEVVRERPGDGGEFLERMRVKGGEVLPRLLGGLRASRVEDVGWVAERVWGMAGVVYAAEYERALARGRHLAPSTLEAMVAPELPEFPVDGTRVGLTPTLRVDSLLPSGIIVEVKTRPPREDYALALAGYALALESMFGTPYDYGVLLYVDLDGRGRRVRVYERVVGLGDDLRVGFVERRDRLAGFVAEGDDPGLPGECSPACPYLHVCGPGRVADRP